MPAVADTGFGGPQARTGRARVLRRPGVFPEFCSCQACCAGLAITPCDPGAPASRSVRGPHRRHGRPWLALTFQVARAARAGATRGFLKDLTCSSRPRPLRYASVRAIPCSAALRLQHQPDARPGMRGRSETDLRRTFASVLALQFQTSPIPGFMFAGTYSRRTCQIPISL